MSDDYEVGYGKPPRHTRFQKGQSGNPAGRRLKTERSITRRQMRRDVLLALETEIDARAPGRSGKLTAIEGVLFKQLELALKGDHKAAKFVWDLRREFTDEHMRLHPDLMEILEIGEQKHASDDSDQLNRHSQMVFNDLRKRTRKV